MRVRSMTTAVLTAAGCVVLAAPALAVVPQEAPPLATHEDPGAEPWVAAWTAAPQGVYPLGYAVGQPGPLGEVVPGVEQPLLEHAFPDEQAQDQTMRMVVHPGIGGSEWRGGLRKRVRAPPGGLRRPPAPPQQRGGTPGPGRPQAPTPRAAPPAGPPPGGGGESGGRSGNSPGRGRRPQPPVTVGPRLSLPVALLRTSA